MYLEVNMSLIKMTPHKDGSS